MEFWNILENELIEFNSLNRQILMKLDNYEHEIKQLLASIKAVDFANSNEIFDRLFFLQGQIATVKYKYNFNIKNFLNDFVYFFR